MSFHTCDFCHLQYPSHVSADISIDWFCHRLVWRGFFLSRWKWKLALRLHLLVCWLIRLPEEQAQL